MLVVRDLRIEVGPRVLLDGANFSVQAGDKVGLVGRNGAGKTTMMRTLVGYQPPASGHVLRSGNLGYFSQEAALPDLEHPDMNALERILSAREIGLMQRKIEETRRKIERLDGDARGPLAPAEVAGDPELIDRIKAWRLEISRGQKVPAYVVLTDASLEELARRRPRNESELLAIKGIGPAKLEAYGDDLLALVADR